MLPHICYVVSNPLEGSCRKVIHESSTNLYRVSTPGPAPLLAVLALSACAGQSEMASVPEAVPNTGAVMERLAPSMQLVVMDDSAADERALQALHELEFRSLGKGANQVRGVVLALDSTRNNPARRRVGSPRGGTASAPTYSLDIESFASHDRVQYYVDFFLEASRARFNIWLGRLARYEGMIRNVLRQYGLAEDLVYLALIESGYSNTAVSRARAIGMWQFIRSTGRSYGLRIDGSKVEVVEADEYDTAFFDKRAKFVHYRPLTLVLNNLEFDHADIYKDLDAII